MFNELLNTFLISISPLGEARAGIPYGAVKGSPIIWVFLVGWIANLLVFPLFYSGISLSNKYLWKNRTYKKIAIYLSQRAKYKTKKNINKYGALGLMVFVMIPLPITGAYIGTLAAYVLGMSYKKAFYAVSAGVTISSFIIATGLYFGKFFFHAS